MFFLFPYAHHATSGSNSMAYFLKDQIRWVTVTHTHMCHSNASAEADVSPRLHSMQLGQYPGRIRSQCRQHFTVAAERHTVISLTYFCMPVQEFTHTLLFIAVTLPWWSGPHCFQGCYAFWCDKLRWRHPAAPEAWWAESLHFACTRCCPH